MKFQCKACKDKCFTESIRDWQENEYLVCAKCGSWNQKNVELTNYEEGYWENFIDPDGNVRNYSQERDFKIQNWYGDAINFVNKARPGRVLDIGGGLGFFLAGISTKWSKHLVEPSKLARNYVGKEFPEISRYASLDDILEKHELDKFDVIMLYHVIEHLDNPEEMLKKLSRIIKNEGVLILGTPNAGSFVAKRFKGNFRLCGKAHLVLYTRKGIMSLLNSAGFKLQHLEYPFFSTVYFTINNLVRLWDRKKISPPFYGNILTLYLRKK